MLIQFRAALMWPLCAVACLTQGQAQAQAQAQAHTQAPNTLSGTAARATDQVISSRPDPSDAAIAVPPARHLSTLRDYQGFADPVAMPWRELNDRVGQRGGWRAYAREPRTGDAPAVPPVPASSPHSGHAAP